MGDGAIASIIPPTLCGGACEPSHTSPAGRPATSGAGPPGPAVDGRRRSPFFRAVSSPGPCQRRARSAARPRPPVFSPDARCPRRRSRTYCTVGRACRRRLLLTAHARQRIARPLIQVRQARTAVLSRRPKGPGVKPARNSCARWCLGLEFPKPPSGCAGRRVNPELSQLLPRARAGGKLDIQAREGKLAIYFAQPGAWSHLLRGIKIAELALLGFFQLARPINTLSYTSKSRFSALSRRQSDRTRSQCCVLDRCGCYSRAWCWIRP